MAYLDTRDDKLKSRTAGLDTKIPIHQRYIVLSIRGKVNDSFF